MGKPYRFLIDRVAGYAEEGSAFLRRRKIRSRPYARVWRSGGAAQDVGLESEAGAQLAAAAADLIAAAPGKR